MYLSLYCKGSKVVWSSTVRGSRWPNRTEIFWPHSHGRQRCVFLVLLMLNRRPWGLLCWVLAFFTTSYQQPLWSPNSIGVLGGPLGEVWLSLLQLVYNSYSNCICNPNCLDFVLTELYNSSTPTRSPTRSLKSHVPIYPTPPLGQDMIQGQFFKRSLRGLNSEFSFS